MSQIKCPACGKTLPADALRCARCSEQLAELPKKNLIGLMVGDVYVERESRRNAFSITFEGVQEAIGRNIYLKMMAKGRLTSEPPKALLREMQALSQLRHANILTLFNVGLYENAYPYMVTERLPGGTLREVLDEQGPMGPIRALSVLQQIASALEAVHDKNILHQNLTPDAISLEQLAGSNQLLAKISNFKIARVGPAKPGESNENGFEIGPEYMAPEQVLGEDLSEATDLYAAGVLLYEMLTNALPYSPGDVGLLWDKIVSERPVMLGGRVPSLASFPQIQAMMDKLLAKKPSARIDTARNLRLLVSRILDDLAASGVDGDGTEAFPVLETAARLKPVRRDQKMPAAVPLQPKPTARGPAPAAASLQLAVTGEIEVLQWRAIVPARVERASGGPYLMLAATSVGTDAPVSAEFAGGAEILLSTTIERSTRLVAITPPATAMFWLRRLVQRATLDGIALGISCADYFPGGVDAVPSFQSTRAALEAARQGGRGWVLMDESAAQMLEVERTVSPAEYDRLGRATSLLRFKP